MALLVNLRNLPVPNLRRSRWVLLGLQQSQFRPQGEFNNLRTILVRTHILKVGTRKKTLLLGALLPKTQRNSNVLLYRKPQPNPTQFYPVFTPWKRRVKALGVQVAPVIPTGGTGSGMNVQHYLGLSLLSLGGLKF